MAGQTIPKPAPGKDAGKAGSWVKQHKLVVVLAFAALLGVYYVIRRNAASSAADATYAANTGLAPAAPGMSSDPSAGGFVDPNSVAGLMTQLLSGQAGLAAEIAGISASPASTSQPGKTNGGLDAHQLAVLHRLHVKNHPPPKPKPKPKPAAVTKPKVGSHTYTVHSGDTLSSIAARLHISGGWQALYTENRTAIGANPNLIHSGLVLHY